MEKFDGVTLIASLVDGVTGEITEVKERFSRQQIVQSRVIRQALASTYKSMGNLIIDKLFYWLDKEDL